MHSYAKSRQLRTNVNIIHPFVVPRAVAEQMRAPPPNCLSHAILVAFSHALRLLYNLQNRHVSLNLPEHNYKRRKFLRWPNPFTYQISCCSCRNSLRSSGSQVTHRPPLTPKLPADSKALQQKQQSKNISFTGKLAGVPCSIRKYLTKKEHFSLF